MCDVRDRHGGRIKREGREARSHLPPVEGRDPNPDVVPSGCAVEGQHVDGFPVVDLRLCRAPCNVASRRLQVCLSWRPDAERATPPKRPTPEAR